jgi:hypothetical protein
MLPNAGEGIKRDCALPRSPTSRCPQQCGASRALAVASVSVYIVTLYIDYKDVYVY